MPHYAGISSVSSGSADSSGMFLAAGGSGAGDIGVVANPPAARQKIKTGKNGTPEAPQKKNKDGTAKNALELGNNLMGGSTIKR